MKNKEFKIEGVDGKLKNIVFNQTFYPHTRLFRRKGRYNSCGRG